MFVHDRALFHTGRSACWPLFALVLALIVVLPSGPAAERQIVTPPRLDLAAPPSTTNRVDGTQIELADQGVKFTLFLPDGWTNGSSSNLTLCAHFHSMPSFTIHEHMRRGARDPLVVFALGTGSSAYRAPFEDTNRFARIITIVEAELTRRGVPNSARIASVDVSSFSAGYGAVRELVKSQRYFHLIRRIVLLDSIYGSLEPQTSGSTNRVPLAEHIEVWLPFARAAIRGEKTFVLTTSQVDTPTYASTSECAAALLERLGLKLSPVAHDTAAPVITLLAKADAGPFHVWSYSGTNAPAHMAHVRHLAEVWQAVERRVPDAER